MVITEIYFDQCFGKLFQCDVCDKLFNNNSVMSVHKRTHFGKGLNKYEGYGDRFSCNSSLKSQYKINEQQNWYENDHFATNLSSYKDDEVNVDQNNLKWSSYGQTYFDCGLNLLKPNYTKFKTSISFIKYSGLKKHLRQKSNLTRHQCIVCNKTFQNKMMMDFHKQIHHRQPPSKDCEDNLNDGKNANDKSESRNKILQLELELEFDRTFSCLPCDLYFADKETFQKHMKSKHVDRSVKKKYACTECDYSFDQNYRLQNHLLSHSKLKPYKCDTCGNTFKQKCSLTHHIKSVHTKETQLKCEECDKTFTRPYSLRQHVKNIHHKIRSYICSKCDKKFTTTSHLSTHMKTHTKVDIEGLKVECEICDKVFTQRIHLRHHVKYVHDNIRSIDCKKCDKKLSNKNQLRVHMRTHNKDKPFPCTICDKSFTRNSYRNTHIKNHTK